MASTVTTKHPFGELLAQYRARRPGLTQTRLAELAGYDQAIVTRMAQGKKDLTGPSGRERTIRIIETLADQNCLTTLDEANALLLAADLPPLFERQPVEAKLIARFGNKPAGLRTRRTNLPALVSSFVGRTSEIAEVRQLLSGSRLVTLTGAGGAGKTRLAQRVAADVLLQYPDGVWYVELAAITDATAIADAAIRALGLVSSDQPALERITEHLRDRHALLVLDNCEHMIDAVATFAITVLHSCPRVTILATSREPMNVEGERAWRVPPMQPDEASRLFIERAIASRSTQNAGDETVAHICERLDGMPLAIELAASRLQVMSLNDIAARLDDRFNLLAHGRRGALPRHQTLRAMIDWSYELLSEEEKVAFRRLGVFVGGWELDLAESLIGNDALARLTQLVNKSLVAVDEANGHTRYRLLETIREYALEKLNEAGEMQAAQRHHAEAVAALVERAEQPLHGSMQKQWLDRINRDRPNLEAALSWSFGSDGDALMGCRIVSMLKMVWLSSPATMSAECWIDCAMATMTDDMPARVRAALHNVHASLNVFYGQPLQYVRAEFEIARRLYQGVGDAAGIADASFNIASLRLIADRKDSEAWQMLHDSVSMAEAAGDMLVANCARLVLAGWTHNDMRFDEAESLLRECIVICEAQHDMANLALAFWGLAHLSAERMLFSDAANYFLACGRVAESIQSPLQMNGYTCAAEIIRWLGDLNRSLEMLEAQVVFAREHLAPGDSILPALLLAKALTEAGDLDRAQALLNEILHYTLKKRLYLTTDVLPHTFDALGCVLIKRGHASKAARLFGFADAYWPLVSIRRWAHNVWEFAPFVSAARSALGDAAYDAARAEGYAMTPEQAIDYALDQDKTFEY
jgi:predicted ATPase